MFDFLSKKFSGVLGWLQNKSHLSEQNMQEALQQVRQALLEADVPLSITNAFLDKVKQEARGIAVQKSLTPGQHFIKIVHEKVLEFLGGTQSATPVFQLPSIILVMGLQGSGKTTTIAKIAQWVQREQKKDKTRRILLASVDFYRPAAIEQLEILAQKIKVDFYRAQSSDPVKAAQEIEQYFKKNSYELLFLDTAGRLHVDETMMEELKVINRLLAPKYKFLVLDAMTGQESLQVAQSFNQAVGFDSAILTKMDSDTRGGAAFGFRYALNKPLSFVGSGEKIDDLELFIPERMTSRILGMGDMMTLIEKTHESINVEDQESLAKKFMSGSFSLKDFADQMSMINKLGSFQKIIQYLPGMGSVSNDMLNKSQSEMKKFQAILSSMTHKEQTLPQILDGSRKKRIARGAGVSVEDVNQLLQRFEQTRQFVKMFKRNNKFGRFFK